MERIDLKKPTSIDEDFALWAAEQSALLRDRNFERTDLENIAEEIEGLARSDKYQIANRLEVLLCHLLKWEFQAERRSNSWRTTLLEQRFRILDLLGESPSLKRVPGERLDSAYILGKNSAITETLLPESTFPETCPYTIEQVLDPDFFPGGE
jgi:hypothetical protein